MRAAALACAGLLLAAGCDRKPAEAPAPAPSASVPVVAQPAAVIAAPAGAYDAISNTAMAVTGDLTASAGTLAFSQGQSYRLEGISTVKAASAYASTQASFASLINVPDAADLSILKVVAEDAGQARNGGFCGKTPTTYLVAFAGPDGSGAPALFVIAFNGAAAPGAASPETELCGTFMYAPKAG